MVDRNGGVFAISVSLTDKGLAKRDEVVAAIFNYSGNAAQRRHQAELFRRNLARSEFRLRYPSITRDMDYIEWLVDTMLRCRLSTRWTHPTWPIVMILRLSLNVWMP